MEVNFIIIGAMKAGTTTLFDILNSHPDIYCSKIKETHFFSKTINWEDKLQQYLKLFKQEEGKIYGEASPTYASLPKFANTSDRIHAYNPEMKIIYMIRNPYERSISHYMHLVERGYTELPMEEAIQEHPQIIETSRYYYQIKPYLDLFGKKQIFIIDFDDFIHEKQKVISDLSDFLEVDYQKFPPFKNIHSNRSLNSYKLHPRYDSLFRIVSPLVKKLPEKLRISIKKLLSNPKRVFKEKPMLPITVEKKIKKFMESEIPELEKIFEKDLSKWSIFSNPTKK